MNTEKIDVSFLVGLVGVFVFELPIFFRTNQWKAPIIRSEYTELNAHEEKAKELLLYVSYAALKEHILRVYIL